MENTSRALLMAGSVLVAILVISVCVYIFNSFSVFSKERTEQINSRQLAEFNSRFTQYEGASDITIYNVISVANYAKNYNDSLVTEGDMTDNVRISVMLDGQNIVNKTDTEKNQLLSNHTITKYKVEEIRFNDIDKRVNYISFKQI